MLLKPLPPARGHWLNFYQPAWSGSRDADAFRATFPATLHTRRCSGWGPRTENLEHLGGDGKTLWMGPELSARKPLQACRGRLATSHSSAKHPRGGLRDSRHPSRFGKEHNRLTESCRTEKTTALQEKHSFGNYGRLRGL